MIGSIILLGVLAMVVGVMAVIYDSYCRRGHSEAYYRYVENNKHPPPDHNNDIDWMGR